MRTFLTRRLLQSLLVLLGVSFVVFFILHLTGDPALVLLSPDASPEDVRRFREAMGFNDPFLVQYWRFLSGAVRGDFGQSVRHGEPAFHLVVERMPATFELAGAGLGLALVLAIPAGIVSAVRRNSLLDYASTVVALLGQSMPTFWLGIMLILLFSVQLQLLPSSGRGTLEHLILPAVTLGLFTTARITRLTRSGMLEVLNQDYIRTARAKGVSDPPVVWKHALKNAAIPIVTIVGIELGTLLGGSVITETIFAWPGVGRLSVQAIYNRDYPVVQAAVFLLAALQVIPPELHDAAHIDGAGRWEGFRFVTLPYLKATLALVLIYETIVAIATFDLVYVMTGGGPADATAIIGWYAYTEIFRFLNLGHGAALAIILGGLLLGLVLVYLRALRAEEA